LGQYAVKDKNNIHHSNVAICATLATVSFVCPFFQKIPDKFVQEHLTGSCSSTQKAMVFSPLGKFWHVELDRSQSGVLLGDGWAQFLTAHNLSEGNILLFRYEDNMVFTVEAILHNGYSKEHGAAAADMTDDMIVIGPSTVLQQGESAQCTSLQWL
jgi:hypothetical protein